MKREAAMVTMPTKESPKPSTSIQEIRENVQADKQLGMEAIRQAGHELKTFQQMSFPTDITGRPDLNRIYQTAKREQYRGLEAVYRKPFYRRICTKLNIAGEVEDLKILISEARGAGGVIAADGWMVVSYSSTLGTQLEGKRLGAHVRIQVPGRAAVSYDIGESTRYETLLPQFENAGFNLRTGDTAYASEAELDAEESPASSPTELPAKEYAAKATFGLSDIIVLRDDPQIGAMALPFGHSVVIEGPPGSGKTSVGIMRLAAMYDRQWDELGLTHGKDAPFHDYSTMQVLVYNPEMVESLKGLAQSIGVQHVHVNTTYDYFRQICRRTKLLTGTARKDKPRLAIMKGRREALRAFFAGFQTHAARFWESRKEDLRKSLFAIGPDFLVLADRLESWIGRVKEARVDGDKIIGSIGVTDTLTDAQVDIVREQSRTRRAQSAAGTLGERAVKVLGEEALKKRLPEAKALVEEVVRGACSRAGAANAMFGLPEFVELKASMETGGIPAKIIEDGERLWRRQYKGALPAYSELDLAASAWLGAKLLLTSRTIGAKPWIGGRLERLTHFVVDEVQDLSPSHISVLASQLVENGTMTLVGDIHQNLNPHAGLRRWEDIGLSGVTRTAFGVNYRQTMQLGNFVKALHGRLFDEECSWEASKKLTGSLPRVGIGRSWTQIARAVAEEARHWRHSIDGDTGATVAVLYDGKMKPSRLNWLRKRVAEALQDELVAVEVASQNGGGEVLRRTDQIVIASVRQTKGLEFDAVIFIEPRPRWAKPMHEIDLRIRNGFYVATSRARAGLSICMSNLPDCIDPLIGNGSCESVKWEEELSE
jgi:hypothetical protein